jgi:hypothetical protein
MSDAGSGADTADVWWSDERDAYTTRFADEDGRYSPSVAVAETLEVALDGCERPLFDYVDTLVTASAETTVSFGVESVTVTVHGDGRVFVRS